MVDKDCPAFGCLIVHVQKGYVELYKRIGKAPYKTTSFARILLKLDDPKKVSEHINGNPFDNRMCNLRVCEQNKNVKNRRPYSKKTIYKGFSIGNNSRSISVELQNEKILHRLHMNQYFIEKMAAVLYDVIALEKHGEYSRTNFNKLDYEKSAKDFIWNLIKNDIVISSTESKYK